MDGSMIPFSDYLVFPVDEFVSAVNRLYLICCEIDFLTIFFISKNHHNTVLHGIRRKLHALLNVLPYSIRPEINDRQVTVAINRKHKRNKKPQVSKEC